MDQKGKGIKKPVFCVITQRFKTCFELLRSHFAPHAETDLERAEQLERRRREDAR
jgi:hypothetical protein